MYTFEYVVLIIFLYEYSENMSVFTIMCLVAKKDQRL